MRSASSYRGAFDREMAGLAEFISAEIYMVAGRTKLCLDCKYRERRLCVYVLDAPDALTEACIKLRKYIAEHPNALS